jgi:hypothetical protein
MTDHEKLISVQLDQAREMEEYYRALLLFWKQRRQRLEAQIVTDDPFTDFLKELLDDRPNRLPTDTP